METVIVSLTVFYDGQFWVGVFERQENGMLTVARYVFGAEPKDSEVFYFICSSYFNLLFSPQVTAEKAIIISSNAKTRQRKINKIFRE